MRLFIHVDLLRNVAFVKTDVHGVSVFKLALRLAYSYLSVVDISNLQYIYMYQCVLQLTVMKEGTQQPDR